MKKHALRWGLVVSLLLAMFTVSAGAEGTATITMPDEPTCAHYSDGAGVHGDDWTAFTTTAFTNYPKLTAGKYYLDQANFAAHPAASPDTSGTIAIYGDVTLCLNGNNITQNKATGAGTTSTYHLFSLQAGASLTLCDCSEGKTGFIKKECITAEKAVFMVRAGCTLNVFDVDLTDCAADTIVRTHVTGGTVNFVDVAVTGYSDSMTNFAPFAIKSGYTLNLYNCQITDPTFDVASAVNGVIYAEAGGTVNMENTTISGATNSNSTMKAAVYLTGSNATLNMFDGCYIKDNVDGADCGGVFVDTSATFNMYGGEISGNTCTAHGGGVRAAGTFNMYDGTISGNTASANGGGVHAAGTGTFNMYNGTIENNESTGNGVGGGGVSVAGIFNMYNGTIQNNTAGTTSAIAGLGGAVRVYSNGNFTMDDGTIIGNTARRGGSIHVEKKVTINGGVIGENDSAWSAHSILVAPSGDLTVNGGSIYGGSGQDIMIRGVDSGKTANITFNGGVIGYLVDMGSTGTVNVAFNGGFFPKEYTAGKLSTGAVYTIADNMKFKEYGSGYRAYVVGAESFGTNMNLGEDLKVMFNFKKAGVEPKTALVTFGNDRQKTVDVTSATLDGVEAYVLEAPIKATEMAKTITVELKDADGNVINVERDSIKAYGERVLAKDTESDAHTLIIDMLNYGAAAQQYFSEETVDEADLANNGIGDCACATACTATEVAEATMAELSKYNFAGNRAYHSANLTLDDKVDFNLYFWKGQIKEGTTYSYSINGTEKVSGATFSEYLDTTGDQLLYKVAIEDLSIADLETAKVKISFTDLDGEKEIEDSVYNYLARTNGKSRLDKDGTNDYGLSMYLMAFANSADYYVHTQPGENETPIG